MRPPFGAALDLAPILSYHKSDERARPASSLSLIAAPSERVVRSTVPEQQEVWS
jgi:hypothetical protein